MANFHRWKTLIIPYDAEGIIQRITGRIPNLQSLSPNNRLETLRLLDVQSLEYGEDNEVVNTIGQAFLPVESENHDPSEPPSLFPALRSLAIWSSGFGLASLQDVRKLDLYVVPWVSWTSFQAALSEAQHLETLRITSMPPTYTNEPTIPLNLPSLRDLTIGKGSHEDFMGRWFLDTTAPNLREFSLELSPRGVDLNIVVGWLEKFVSSSCKLSDVIPT